MARDRITIGSTTELLNDARLPASLGTAGQMLKMNSGATAIEWGEGGGDSISRNASDALVVSAGTNTAIEANPTLTGTETTLAGLKVGDTKYAIPSGGSTLYRHNIYFKTTSTTTHYVRGATTIINASNTPFTFDTMCAFLRTTGSSSTYYYVGGISLELRNSSGNQLMPCLCIVESDSSLSLVGVIINNATGGDASFTIHSSDLTAFVDTVQVIS